MLKTERMNITAMIEKSIPEMVPTAKSNQKTSSRPSLRKCATMSPVITISGVGSSLMR